MKEEIFIGKINAEGFPEYLVIDLDVYTLVNSSYTQGHWDEER